MKKYEKLIIDEKQGGYGFIICGKSVKGTSEERFNKIPVVKNHEDAVAFANKNAYIVEDWSIQKPVK
jgi:hypothetical protein